MSSYFTRIRRFDLSLSTAFSLQQLLAQVKTILLRLLACRPSNRGVCSQLGTLIANYPQVHSGGDRYGNASSRHHRIRSNTHSSRISAQVFSYHMGHGSTVCWRSALFVSVQRLVCHSLRWTSSRFRPGLEHSRLKAGPNRSTA